MLIHNNEYNILSTKIIDGYRYDEVEVGNKYEKGSVFRRHNDIRRNKFRDPMKILANGCYYGIGKYSLKMKVTLCDKSVQYIDFGSLYQKMVGRSYYRKYSSNNNKRDYANVTLSDEWKSYQKWMKWVDSDSSNFRPGYQIDKDILGNGLTYSSESCCYIPPYLNKFVSSKNSTKMNAIYIFKNGISIPKEEYMNIKHYCVRLLANEYFLAYMIPIKVKIMLDTMFKLTPSDDVLKSEYMKDIMKIIKENVKNESKIYKSVIKIEPIRKFRG